MVNQLGMDLLSNGISKHLHKYSVCLIALIYILNSPVS